MTSDPIHIVGGGLAGSEAAWQLVSRGFPVVLHEMRPTTMTPAHETAYLAELVCSNSFRADDSDANAVGLLHDEMRRCNSLIMQMADKHRVPAGGALAVDRGAFAEAVTQALRSHPLVTVVAGEVNEITPDWQNVIIASGPLTSPALADWIRARTGADTFSFFDAIAPIVLHESIDMTKAWKQSRYDKGSGIGGSGIGGSGIGDGADYINCALDRPQYEAFVEGLVSAKKTEFKDWEKDAPYFDGCLPIEVMAARGPQTLRFGPMKPVGLTNPHCPDQRPYAVIQLRQDNAQGTLFNIVGFQTKMIHSEQTRLFRTIPGLENAVFARLGGLHRNSFINSPILLDNHLRLKKEPRLRFAGQITGVEGYVESTAIGLLSGLFAAKEKMGEALPPLPPTTAMGALLRHITGEALPDSFQPSNVTFGMFPPLEEPPRGGRKGRPARKQAMTSRAKAAFTTWLQGSSIS